MKSVNKITLTGRIINVPVTSESGEIKFLLHHPFAKGKQPLIMGCIIPRKIIDTIIVKPLEKGVNIRIEAYLSMRGEKITAIIKSIYLEMSK